MSNGITVSTAVEPAATEPGAALYAVRLQHGHRYVKVDGRRVTVLTPSGPRTRTARAVSTYAIVSTLRAMGYYDLCSTQVAQGDVRWVDSARPMDPAQEPSERVVVLVPVKPAEVSAV